MPDPLSPAAALVRLPSAVLSHQTAARELGLELVHEAPKPSLTVPRSHGHVRLEGWQVRRADVAEEETEHRADGTRLTTPARTVVDLARALPLAEAVACADSALRKKQADLPALVTSLHAQRGPGSARCRAVAALLDPASGSVLESLLRVLLSTLPEPRPLS